ncbi:uncharacterized protein LOC105690524 [Athalia rosae]|uniref:uncharacterized protein LOC105690524 n=1 Tax=Athalia rosae TaxID=37344 RepID=UPI0020341A89|nr:uncharacterized protein LOC105690524 [Athalia rosae]
MLALKIIPTLLFIEVIVTGSHGNTRFLTKVNNNVSTLFKTKNDNFRIPQEPIAVTKNPLELTKNTRFENDAVNIEKNSKFERKNIHVETSTFNPDVLNKFLEEYAAKMKSTTENNYKYPFTVLEHPVVPFQLEVKKPATEESKVNMKKNATLETTVSNGGKTEQNREGENANDTLERNKQWGNNPYDDRNGWVTLEAIPWSKSKISKWQANKDSQKPWPEDQPWDKPQGLGKPSWLERPAYEENVPWFEKPKPYHMENTGSQKPWYDSERPKPSKPTRPSYFEDNGFGSRPNYAQKWPPEKPWDKYGDSLKESSDIITDDKPANFPAGNWAKPQISKPSHSIDRFPDINPDNINNDWKTHDYNFPLKYEELNNRPSNFPKPSSTSFNRPHFSHYQYSTDHPPSHPANGDGQWVLLSTNRGYSKSRQRSIKIASTNGEGQSAETLKNDRDPSVAVMTSKRQVRLTVLPSVNGTNTTTSHGGLLEVEKTFKTVDQSQREYEREKLATVPSVVAKRPIRNTPSNQPSNSAVLAAVGAGMLPATMAMVIPMMLGRKKRSVKTNHVEITFDDRLAGRLSN